MAKGTAGASRTVYAALGAAIVAIGWISVGMLGKDAPKDS